MSGPSDSELLERARQGDAAAFGSLIRRHDKHLYRIARSMLPDDQEAEDAVQETYIRAFTGLRDFRGAASLRTWLTRIVLTRPFGEDGASARCLILTRFRLRRNGLGGRLIRLR